MRHNKQLFTFFILFVISFLFFSSNTLSIVHENDINFSWISTIIYNESNPNDFEIDDTLNFTTYNGIDYYEHVYPFESKNYSYYYNRSYYGLNHGYYSPVEIIFINNSIYLFEYETTYDIYIYDLEFNLIEQVNNPLNSIFDHVNSITHDDNYIYAMGTTYFPLEDITRYYIVRLDYSLNVINVFFETYRTDGGIWRQINYFNNSLYLFLALTGSYAVERYDLKGSLVISYDINSYINSYSSLMSHYRNKWYFYHGSNQDIYIFDDNFNHIETFSRSFTPYSFSSMNIYQELVFTFNNYKYLHVYNITFEEQEKYSIIDYYPNEYGLFDSVDNVNITLQEQTNPIGNYQATYSFENQIGLMGTEIEGIDGIGNDYTANVIDYKLSHKDVLEVYRSGSYLDFPYSIIENSISGYIEAWIYSENNLTFTAYQETNDNDERVFSLSYLGATNTLNIYYGNLSYTSVSISDWTHVKICFDCINDNQSVWINGNLELDNENFVYDNDLDYVSMISYASGNSHYAYYDAIGFYEMKNGNYSGSYDFDVIDTWYTNNNSGSECYAEHLDYSYEHRDVVRMIDNSASQLYFFINYFYQECGSIEFWYLSENQNAHYLTFYSNVGQEFYIQWYSNDLKVVDGNGDNHLIPAGTYPNNVWYHYRIDFETSTSGYLGLSQYQAKFYLNNELKYTSNDWLRDETCSIMNRINFQAHSTQKPVSQLDGLGFSWLDNYTIGQNLYDDNFYDYSIGQNLQYSIEYNGFWNEIVLYNESLSEIISIECLNGTYYINGTTTNYNVFFNSSQYIYDTWIINIDINDDFENCLFNVYNESNSLLFSTYFNCSIISNVKYIKYIQHYQNSSHFIYLSNFDIQSNNTRIFGLNGFMSYALDLEDTDIWDFSVSSILSINYYGSYRFYVSNDTYGSENASMIGISGFIDSRNQDISFDLSYLDISIQNPYLIVETINGMYLLNNIKINGSSTSWILYDDRGYSYDGIFTYSNIDIDNSYFNIQNNILYYRIKFNDDNTEYIKLIFDIENIDNTNYKLLYETYKNESNVNIIAQFNLKNNDGSYTNIDIDYAYNSDIEILEQDKITTHVEILISDNDLFNDNTTIYGWIRPFTFNYAEQISISLFIEQILIMLIPIIIILSVSISLCIILRDKKRNEPLNRRAFFPIFIIVSILTFIMGYFEAWILFVMIIATIIYVIKKREDL